MGSYLASGLLSRQLNPDVQAWGVSGRGPAGASLQRGASVNVDSRALGLFVLPGGICINVVLACRGASVSTSTAVLWADLFCQVGLVALLRLCFGPAANQPSNDIMPSSSG
jgi:hypothetical protein